jgi:hypothetical protein
LGLAPALSSEGLGWRGIKAERFRPRLEERKEASEYFLAFALLHAGCGDEVIEARLDKRALACWC